MTQAPAQSGAKVLLAVGEINPVSAVLAKRLKAHGFEVRLCDSMDALRDFAHECPPDILLVDGGVEYAEAARRWAKKQYHEKVPSLVSLRPGDAARAAADEGLLVLDDETLAEPYEIEDLCALLGAEYARICDERRHILHSFALKFRATEANAAEAAEFLERTCKHYGIAREHSRGFLVAVREALDNALHHGCEGCPECRVLFSFILTPGRLEATVEDTGPGFDAPAKFAAGLDGDAAAAARAWRDKTRGRGLGLLIMARCSDRLEYSRSGSLVRICRNLPAPAAGNGAAREGE